MTTMAETKVERLKAELQTAERELVSTTTVTAELSGAVAEQNEAARVARLNQQRLAEAVESARFLESEFNRIDGTFHPDRKQGARQAILKNNDVIRELEAEVSRSQIDLDDKRSTRAAIEKRIASHPTYAQTIALRREVVEEATALVTALYRDPLLEMKSVIAKIVTAEKAERDIIESTQAELRDAGLPQIEPLLRNFATFVTPSFLEQIPHERENARKHVEQRRERASRDIG
ncbi:MAG: hypothetical protein ACRD4M_07660 [Candidatus Acidiferrales bacterium]